MTARHTKDDAGRVRRSLPAALVIVTGIIISELLWHILPQPGDWAETVLGTITIIGFLAVYSERARLWSSVWRAAALFAVVLSAQLAVQGLAWFGLIEHH